MSKRFPAHLFVVREVSDDDEPFFVSFDDEGDAVDEAENGGEIGVYKLESVGEAQIVRTLNPKKDG